MTVVSLAAELIQTLRWVVSNSAKPPSSTDSKAGLVISSVVKHRNDEKPLTSNLFVCLFVAEICLSSGSFGVLLGTA